MTKKQIEEYQKRYNLDLYRCKYCERPASQIAHRLSKSKVNYKLYGKDIIDNNINLVSVCSLDCNIRFNIGSSKQKVKKLVELIKTRGNKLIDSDEITDIINE